MRPIEQERDWELAARQQSRTNLLKWVLVAMGVTIVVVLALVATSHGQYGSSVTNEATATRGPVQATPYFWHLVETHCVAVLTEAHTEKISRDFVQSDPPHEIDHHGNEVFQVPEQLLNLRCK